MKVHGLLQVAVMALPVLEREPLRQGVWLLGQPPRGFLLVVLRVIGLLLLRVLVKLMGLQGVTRPMLRVLIMAVVLLLVLE